MPRSPVADIRRFYEAGGYVKPKAKTDPLLPIRQALYGSQFYALGGHIGVTDLAKDQQGKLTRAPEPEAAAAPPPAPMAPPQAPMDTGSANGATSSGDDGVGFDRGGKVIKKLVGRLRDYVDPPAPRIDDWKWRPIGDVAGELPGEVPPHVLQFGDYMDTMAKRAGDEGLSPRDVLKGYGTTLSSIQRQAVNRDNLDLPLSSSERMIRPEGAFADWLGTKHGQRYLARGAEGEADTEALSDMAKRLGPFGMMPTLTERLTAAPGIVAGREGRISELVDRAAKGRSSPDEWREVAEPFAGIGPSKAGFFASLLGRGDIPTLDARQLILHTGEPTAAARPWLKGPRGVDAVDRLAARQDALGMFMPQDYKPYGQHLTHHTVWDAAGNEKTTHQDVIDMMLHRAGGGPVPYKTGGSTIKELLKRIQKSIAGEDVNLVDRSAEMTGRDRGEIIDALRTKTAGIKGDTINERGITNLKGTDAISNARAGIYDPNPLTPPWLTPQDLVGHVGVGGMSDRTAAGQIVTDLNGMRLKRPILTQGGPGFSMHHPELWAADRGAVSAFANAVKGSDLPPIFMTKQMGQQSHDQSHMMMDAVSQLLRDAPISRNTDRAFTKYVRDLSKPDPKTKEAIQFLPDFPGARSENLYEYLLDQPMSNRAQLVKAMDVGKWNEAGIPNPTSARMALNDPRLYAAPTNTPGATVGRFDIGNPHVMDPDVPHPSYPVGLRGDFMGRMERVLPWEKMFPDFAASVAHKKKPQADRAYQLSPVTQRFDQQWLDQVMPEWERAPGWAGGGKVSQLIKRVAHAYGAKQAQRAERAADSVDLSRYNDDALRDVFDSRNRGLLTTLRPSEFEKYASPLPKAWTEEVPYRGSGAGYMDWGGDYKSYIDGLKDVAVRGGGFDETPALWFQKTPHPIFQERKMPLVTAHDGRHRMRALADLDDDFTLVNLMPEQYGALGRQSGNARITPNFFGRMREVLPQKYSPSDPTTWQAQQLPNDVFARGGRVGDDELYFTSQMMQDWA